MPLAIEYPHLMLLNLGSKRVLVIVSICVSSRTATRGTSCPMAQEFFPYQNDKINRQWASHQFFLFTICIAFYWGMLHIMLIMGCCKFPPWHMAWVGGPGVSLAHIQTPWTHKSPTYFTPEGIQKQKKHDINLKWETKAVLKAFPMTHGSANFQLIICRHIHHKIVTMVQTSYEQENKVCHQVRESFTYYFSHKTFLVWKKIKQKTCFGIATSY